MKNKLMCLYYCWNSLMNLKYNPIGYIPNLSIQMYFMIILSILWTFTFCTLVAGWLNVVSLVYGHIAFIFSIFLLIVFLKMQKKMEESGFINGKENIFLQKHLKKKIKQKTLLSGTWKKKHDDYSIFIFTIWMCC